VLGAIAMIEAGEVDWKVVVLSVDDPYAERIADIDEVAFLFCYISGSAVFNGRCSLTGMIDIRHQSTRQ
jgi:hypothetical protein